MERRREMFLESEETASRNKSLSGRVTSISIVRDKAFDYRGTYVYLWAEA